MTRPPAFLRPSRTRLAFSALALALLSLPPEAGAQFTGNTGNDLTSSGSTEISQVNNANANANNERQGQASSKTDGGLTDDIERPTLRARSPSAAASGNALLQPEPPPARATPYVPSEFELYVQRQASAGKTSTSSERPVRRFGANLLTDPAYTSAAQDPLPTVPADYVIRPGDEIALTIWGSVDADLRLTVDRGGRIAVPRVGSIPVAGLRNGELSNVLTRHVGQTFRNFQLTATLGQVRAIRVFVSGYAQRPGSVMVNGLSSVLHAIMRAGGPSAAGSFRGIHLRRGGREVATFDLYDLLLKGDHGADQLVQPDDLIFIDPVGTQVAVLGSVNEQAVFELKPGETLDDAMRMAGGFNAVADRSRVALERLADRATGHVTELPMPAHGTDQLATGDLVRVFSVVTAALPTGRQNEHVRIEGEVLRPGDYILAPGSRISDALAAAGGMTSAAYPFGTEFTRETVRQQQQANYDRALRDLETDMSRGQASQRATSAEDLNAQNATAQANARLLDRLRQVRPTGRVVLQLAPDARSLPDLPLEDGDTLKIPPTGTSVGVFGSVFNSGSFVFESGHTTQQYLALAGGPTRGADKKSIFMIRANGSVISVQQNASFWHTASDFNEAIVQPGDTIFVPEQIDKSTFVQDAKDWTQILYQFGLGLAGIKSLGL